MRKFRKIIIASGMAAAVIIAVMNLLLSDIGADRNGRFYRVEVSRIADEIEKKGLAGIDLSKYTCVTDVVRIDDTSLISDTDHDYMIQEIRGVLYRFDYRAIPNDRHFRTIIAANAAMVMMTAVIAGVLLYIRNRILKPFDQLCSVPYELSRGNLTTPVKEEKNHFWGRFLWGIDLLRENMEHQKEREHEILKDQKMLVLSISHDIKTPLSAIKLYAKALSKGLYSDVEKQKEIAENIDAKADEIEGFVAQMTAASKEDFLELDVCNGEFYLSELEKRISGYYKEKLKLVKIPFSVGAYVDCILVGDVDRAVEALQNMIENAVKYGDGDHITIEFSEEEDCELVTIKNSGCMLEESELPHIFDSFFRGSNVGSSKGSGLGLYICRQIMRKMGGEIFAQIQGEEMLVTAVFQKAL